MFWGVFLGYVGIWGFWGIFLGFWGYFRTLCYVIEAFRGILSVLWGFGVLLIFRLFGFGEGLWWFARFWVF